MVSVDVKPHVSLDIAGTGSLSVRFLRLGPKLAGHGRRTLPDRVVGMHNW